MGNKQATPQPDEQAPTTRRVPAAILTATAATLALLLTGCGSGSNATTANQGAQASNPTATRTTPATTTAPTSTPTTTTAPPATHTTIQQQAPANEQIVLTSPAIDTTGALQPRYTCDGQDTPPPLTIKGVPPGTAELMLDIIKVSPVNNKLYFAWAVTHINPATHEINQGKLPPGAITGTNSSSQTTYHLCPPKGPTQNYVAVIFALPHKLPANPGFNPTQLRLQAEHTAQYQNLLIYHYKRQ
jgi:phosphatidylethanolamine-binding protein (PEBP) family uncharacterized protein